MSFRSGAVRAQGNRRALVEHFDSVTIVDEVGAEGFIQTPVLPEEAEYMVSVRLKDRDLTAEVPAALLVPKEDGGYYLPARLADFQSGPKEKTRRDEAQNVIPLAQEELHIEKRTAETGRVRLTKAVHEREEEADLYHVREEIEVERIPLNRVVDAPPALRHEGDTMIVPVLEEVLVVQKQLILKEEVHIKRKRVRTAHPERVKLRSEQILVERVAPQGELHQQRGSNQPVAARKQASRQREE
jgi:uncharacterized protein (TIGR02271 family)